MPSEKRTRLLESLTGTGLVCDGDAPIAKVRFSLTITRERSNAGSSSGDQEPPRLKDIRGVITILAGERHLVSGSRLVLSFSDGHQWEFTVQSGNFISGEYVAIGTGRQDIVPS